MTAEDNGRREAALHKLRMALEQVLGEIELLEQKLPGVYYACLLYTSLETFVSSRFFFSTKLYLSA